MGWALCRRLQGRAFLDAEAMKIGDLEFSVREFGGALGDFGTLLPFVVGYIAICGLDAFGLLATLGIVSVLVGLIYKIPLAVQPKKAIGAVALAGRLTPGQIYGAGLGLGLFWILAATTGLVEKLEKITPHHVVIAIQVSLAVQLALKALSMMSEDIMLSTGCVLLGVLLLKRPILSAPIVLLMVGIIYSCITGTLSLKDVGIALPDIHVMLPSLDDIGTGMLTGGLVQIPLTLTNACLATASLPLLLFS